MGKARCWHNSCTHARKQAFRLLNYRPCMVGSIMHRITFRYPSCTRRPMPLLPPLCSPAFPLRDTQHNPVHSWAHCAYCLYTYPLANSRCASCHSIMHVQWVPCANAVTKSLGTQSHSHARMYHAHPSLSRHRHHTSVANSIERQDRDLKRPNAARNMIAAHADVHGQRLRRLPGPGTLLQLRARHGAGP